MNELKTTDDVLKALGVRYWTLYAAMRAGHVPKPSTKVGLSFVWTPNEVEAARQYFDNPDRTIGKPKKGVRDEQGERHEGER